MSPPAKGSRSSSSNSDLEAMKSAHIAAISSNEKIFPVFAKKLASKDTSEYISTTRKLAAWLGSEKAYYPAARPKIVELLEIALSAFMDTFVHHSAIAQFAELLRQLVQAVIPFIHLFSEAELQSRLQRVIMETERSLSGVFTNSTQSNVLPQGVVHANALPPSLTSPVNVHTQPMIPPLPTSQKPQLQIQLSSFPAAIRAASDGSFHVEASHARTPAELASCQNVANPPPTSPVINTPQESSGSISSSIPSKPQPKRTRRAELPEALIARDLHWFKSNQGSAVVNGQDPSALSSKARETSLVEISTTAHIPGRSPKKSARIFPARRLPRRSLDAAREMESSPSLPSTSEPPAVETGSFESVSIQNIDDQPPLSERTESDARSAAMRKSSGTQEISPYQEFSFPQSQLAATSPNNSPVEPEIPQTDHQFASVGAPLLNGDSAISHPSTPPPQTKLDRMESMDISSSDIASERVPSDPPFKPESTPQSSQALHFRSPILPPLVGAWEPPLNLDFKISQIPSDQRQPSAMDVNQRRFDGEMTVIHSAQGKPFTYTHVIDVTLNEDMFSKIIKWTDRRSRPSDASHGVCISLACYHLPEFFDKIKSGGDRPGFEALTLQSSCSWPDSNRLSLRINDETRQTIITLSPPLFLTSDQCVDLTPLMKPGNNTLEVRQHGDLSEYLVVLHAHRPTLAQLAEHEVVKTADERWKLFLDAISARVMPGRTLGTGPAGVVGAF